MRRTLVPVLVMATLAMAVGACSSDDDGGSADPEPDVAATASSTSETSATSGSADPDATEPSTGGDPTITAEPTAVPGSTAAGPGATSLPSDVDDPSTTVATAEEGAGGTPAEPAEELEESLSGLGIGVGAGVVEIGDTTWTFEAEICDRSAGFLATGPGSTADGTVGFVEVFVDVGADLDGDGDVDDSGSVSVAVGRTDLLSADAPDQPLWLSSVQTFADVDQREFTYEIDGARITGEGEIRQRRGVDVAQAEVLPLSFEATCG